MKIDQETVEKFERTTRENKYECRRKTLRSIKARFSAETEDLLINVEENHKRSSVGNMCKVKTSLLKL